MSQPHDETLDAQPDEPAAWVQQGSAQLAAGDFDAAVSSFTHGLALAPRMFVARLQLGIAQEQLGQSRAALGTYFAAIESARALGRWQDDATTASGLRDTVKYAVNYVNKGRRQLFHDALEPLRQRYGRDELVRVERSLAIYLLEQPANIPDPRQHPTFLYFPDIASQPYYPRRHFPWLEALEAATDAVRDELLRRCCRNNVRSSRSWARPPHRQPGACCVRPGDLGSRLGRLFLLSPWSAP